MDSASGLLFDGYKTYIHVWKTNTHTCIIFDSLTYVLTCECLIFFNLLLTYKCLIACDVSLLMMFFVIMIEIQYNFISGYVHFLNIKSKLHTKHIHLHITISYVLIISFQLSHDDLRRYFLFLNIETNSIYNMTRFDNITTHYKSVSCDQTKRSVDMSKIFFKHPSSKSQYNPSIQVIGTHFLLFMITVINNRTDGQNARYLYITVYNSGLNYFIQCVKLNIIIPVCFVQYKLYYSINKALFLPFYINHYFQYIQSSLYHTVNITKTNSSKVIYGSFDKATVDRYASFVIQHGTVISGKINYCTPLYDNVYKQVITLRLPIMLVGSSSLPLTSNS